MNDLASIFLPQSDKQDALWELYNTNTKLSPAHMPPVSAEADPIAQLNEAIRKLTIEEIEAAVGSGGKRYPTSETLALPEAFPAAINKPFGNILESRISEREFAISPLSIKTISGLCRIACGIKPSHVRTEETPTSRYVPSAGALYPLELYLFSAQPLTKRGKGDGGAEIWHYEPQQHNLERIVRCDLERIADCFQTWPEQFPPITAVITGVPKRQSWKYGARAYRYTVMEAGHAVQNILLGATAMNLSACPVVGFYDDRIHDLLDIDGVSEIALYTVWMGERPKQLRSVESNQRKTRNEQ
ncbi:MAG: SagB/ThcOx family dehydrogenase [Verrucomicrobia bacterium]|nr:SagB/ThcOx family dehydrogenase [Verrucomicrobiota bacterium]MCH8510948.1 SagB/ThcOx family dehydrogenase [Kiritimatiellia bacterium]